MVTLHLRYIKPVTVLIFQLNVGTMQRTLETDQLKSLKFGWEIPYQKKILKEDKLKIYVGWDRREDIAYQACKLSILNTATVEVDIIPLKQKQLRKRHKKCVNSNHTTFSAIRKVAKKRFGPNDWQRISKNKSNKATAMPSGKTPINNDNAVFTL